VPRPAFTGDVNLDSLTEQVLADFDRLARLIDGELAARGRLPDMDALDSLWAARYPHDPFPTDPFDGLDYGYVVDGREYRLWSSGPDGEGGTDDDIVRAPSARVTR